MIDSDIPPPASKNLRVKPMSGMTGLEDENIEYWTVEEEDAWLAENNADKI